MKLKYLIATFFLISTSLLVAQELQLPSNPLDGRIVFEEKGCIECHSIGGYGGTTAPDLARKKYYGSFLELSAIIWNHIPQMNRKFREINFERPSFNVKEMQDLIYFIYYLRYLGEPGSVSNGKKLLSQKGCISCHKVAGSGGEIAPDFSELGEYSSPVFMAQAMWNHGPKMFEKMKEKNMKFPEITGSNINDISAYIRQASGVRTELRMSPGNPVNGKKLFKEKGCVNCHNVNGGKVKDAPNLSELKFNKSVTEIAAQMWSHSPNMLDFMNENNIKYPQFNGNEMADLISYLYFTGFEDKAGDPAKGRMVFENKGCINCHETGDAPDLSSVKSLNSRLRILQRMWNHALKMEDLLIIQNNKWPVLSKEEMKNLDAYLISINKK